MMNSNGNGCNDGNCKWTGGTGEGGWGWGRGWGIAVKGAFAHCIGYGNVSLPEQQWQSNLHDSSRQPAGTALVMLDNTICFMFKVTTH